MKKETLASGSVVLRPKGYLTGGIETEVLEGDLKVLIDGGVTGIIIDCSEVQHLNSQPLGILIDAKRELAGTGRQLDLAGIDQRIENGFVRDKLTEMFKVWPSVEVADAAIIERRSAGLRAEQEGR